MDSASHGVIYRGAQWTDEAKYQMCREMLRLAILAWIGAASKEFAFCGLPLQKKGLWGLAFAADFERAEIFVPGPVGSIGFGIAPELQFVKVFGGDLALFEAIEKVLAESGRKVRPLNLRHRSLTLTGRRKLCGQVPS